MLNSSLAARTLVCRAAMLCCVGSGTGAPMVRSPDGARVLSQCEEPDRDNSASESEVSDGLGSVVRPPYVGSALGCVTEFAEPQVDHGSGQVGKAHPTAARFVAAKRDPGGVLEAGEGIFDGKGLGVDRPFPPGGVWDPPLWGG